MTVLRCLQAGADKWIEPDDTIETCNRMAADGGNSMLLRTLAVRHARALADLALLEERVRQLSKQNETLQMKLDEWRTL